MTLAIEQAIICGYGPSNDSLSRADADYIIAGGDINSIELSQRGKELKDSATFDISNYGGKYTNKVDHGDRIEVYLARGQSTTRDTKSDTDTDTSTTDVDYGQYGYGGYEYGGADTTADTTETETIKQYGGTQYGTTQYPGDALNHHWTGRVRKITNEAHGADNYSLKFDAEDFVYGLMGSRRLWASYVGAPLTGSPDAILNDALARKTPEIGQSQIRDIGGTTDLQWTGRTLLSLLKELLNRGNATAASDGMNLVVRNPSNTVPEFTLSKGSGDWRLPSFQSNDDELINDLRVAGGVSPELDDSVDKTGETEVTKNTRIMARVNTRVSSLHSIELWTEDVSDDSVLIRLQQDDGGSPVAVDDKQSDIVNEQMQHDELTDGGWTSFELPNHTLPEPNPWLIVESTDVDGQMVGTDGAGNPAYRAFFPFPVSVEQQVPSSVDEYGRREGRVTDESLRTATASYDHADAVLGDRSEPAETVSFVANSERTHNLAVADLVRIQDEYLGVEGTFVITQVDDKITGGTVERSVTAESLASV